MWHFAKLALALVLMANMIFTAGCGSEEPPAASESDDTDGPPTMPPPEGPGAAAPNSGDPSAFPTEGEPSGLPPSTETPARPADAPSELPTEGEPAGEVQPPGAATVPPSADQAQAAKIEASLASLSAEDRALALKQKICLVSGGPLGAMGPPIKISVAGHEVFICCKGCERALLSDPAKHLAKISLTPADGAEVQ
jgi:hypothetical protein